MLDENDVNQTEYWFNSDLGDKDNSELADLPAPMYEARADWSFGPVEISANYKDEGIDVEVNLGGVRLLRGRITKDNASLGGGLKLGIVKASVQLVANFDAKELVATGNVCRKNWKGHWKCDDFSACILRW